MDRLIGLLLLSLVVVADLPTLARQVQALVPPLVAALVVAVLLRLLLPPRHRRG